MFLSPTDRRAPALKAMSCLSPTLREALERLRRIADKRLFFVVGTEKSGTTWLQLLIDHHPHAACRGEGQFAQELWPLLRKGLNDYTKFVQGLNTKVFSEIEQFPILDEAAIQAIQTFASSLLLAEYGDRPEIVAIGEKTPGHIRHLNELKAAFPEARFVFITRDGRDIAISGWYHLKRQYGEDKADPLPDYAKRIAKVWRFDNEQAAAFRECFPGDCEFVRYEDLHAQPEAELGRVFRFLSLDDADGIVRDCIAANAFSKLAHGRDVGEEDTRSHFRKGIVGDWRNHFDAATWSAFDAEAGELLERLGYERAYRPPAPAPDGKRPDVAKPVPDAALDGKPGQAFKQAAAKPSGAQAQRQALQREAASLSQTGQADAAIEAYRALASRFPDDVMGWRMLGVLLKDQGRHAEAIAPFRQALALEDDIPTRNALVIALASAGETAQALIEGLRALERKDAAAMQAHAGSPFQGQALKLVTRAFNPKTPQRNIIAFSLWGDDPTYVQGALVNARIAPHIYYGWTTRFYCDDSVPANALEELRQLGAQVVMLEDPAWRKVRPLWRFLVSDDPNVDFFLCRDADSRLNCQELLAVEDWLRSGKPFHAMRDHVYHMELILAGLWGGMAGVLPNVRELIFGHPQYFDSRFGDQAFLMNVVWPLVRDHLLVHDSYYRFRGAIDFPPGYRLPRPVHVGGAIKFAR